MNRTGYVYYKDEFVGTISENENGFQFQYNTADSQQISLSLPVRTDIYTSNTLFPFFDGLIPEGWLLDIATTNWKIAANDRMGLLLTCCKDCIGAVSVRGEKQ